MQQMPAPPFPILESFAEGLRLMVRHARLFTVLSIFPFAVTLATLVAMRVMGSDLTLFWLPIVQFPSSFVTGLQCALILRFLLLGEYPLVPEGAEREARNAAVMRAAIAYAAITYFITGAYAGLLKLRAFISSDPEAAAPYAPLAMILLVALLWGARWFWLHVPLALEWRVGDLYQRVGKWAGSLRIFALFALCSLTLNFLASFIRLGIAALGGQPQSGFAAAFDDAAVAASTLLLAVLFTAASAAAIRSMAGSRLKDTTA